MNERKFLLTKCGQALYGERWQTAMARDLGLSDGRRIRQWMTGDRPIPEGVWGNLVKLLSDRKLSIDAVLQELKKQGIQKK